MKVFAGRRENQKETEMCLSGSKNVKQKDTDISVGNVKQELFLEICLGTDRYPSIYIFSTVLFAVHLGRTIHITKGEELTSIFNKIWI
jgi:hypothetical protein